MGHEGRDFSQAGGQRERRGSAAETSWGAPCSAKHTTCVNPNMSLQRRKLKRETDNVAGREEKHEREENGKLV